MCPVGGIPLKTKTAGPFGCHPTNSPSNLRLFPQELFANKKPFFASMHKVMTHLFPHTADVAAMLTVLMGELLDRLEQPTQQIWA